MEHLEQFLISSLRSTNFTILEANPVSDEKTLKNYIPCFISEESTLVDVVPKLKDTTIHSGYFCFFDPGKICFASQSFALNNNTPADFDTFVISEYEREKCDKLVNKMKKVIDFETQTVCSGFGKPIVNQERFNNFNDKKSITITMSSPQHKIPECINEVNSLGVNKFIKNQENSVNSEKLSQEDFFYEDGIDINSLNLKNISFVIKDPKRIKKVCYVKFEYDPKSADFFDKLCENCLKNLSYCYCFAERAVLCKECDKSIHNTKLTMRHRREYKDQECVEYSTCSIHQIPTEYFCHSHNHSFCIYCKGNHVNCTFSGYKDSLEIIKNNYYEGVKKTYNQLQQKNILLEEKIRNYNKKVKEIKYEISKEYLGIINKINLLNSINEKAVIGEYLLNNNLLNLFNNLQNIRGNWMSLNDYFNKINVQEREIPNIIEIKKEGSVKINREDERKVERIPKNYD